jgi:flagellin-specific chaperone FliS
MIITTPTFFLVQGQVQSSYQQNLVDLSERAKQEVEALIDWIYFNEELVQEIQDNELLADLEGNVTLFNQGVSYVNSVKTAVELEDYETAVEDAIEALNIFREVTKSIHTILKEVGVSREDIIDMQALLEAILRAQQKIDYLRELISEEDIETTELLDNAETYLDNANEALINENINEAKTNLREANQIISQVHVILKDQAEDSNGWRIFDYCERVRERTRERFRHGSEQGINIDDFLGLLGYQNENQFMETLEGLIQEAKNNSGYFKEALQYLEAIGEMVQQMEGELTQHINQHQNRYGSGGNYGDSGGQNSGGS